MLTTVARYFDPWEAHIVRGRLVADGVPATIAGDQHMIANWPWGVALGGAHVQVPSKFVVRAQAIIDAYHSGALETDFVAEHPEASSMCPVCGDTGQAIRQPSPWKTLLAFVTLIWTAVIFPASSTRLRCKACGHVWQDAA